MNRFSNAAAAMVLAGAATVLFVSGYITNAHSWLWSGVIAVLYIKGARALLLFKRGPSPAASPRECFLTMTAYFISATFFILSAVTGEGATGLIAAPVALSFALAFGIAGRRSYVATARIAVTRNPTPTES
jgi:hypothetical protein